MERVRIRATSRPSTEAEITATAANSRRAGLSVVEESTGICERWGEVMLAPSFSTEPDKSEIRSTKHETNSKYECSNVQNGTTLKDLSGV
jgi:hypothetical protein